MELEIDCDSATHFKWKYFYGLTFVIIYCFIIPGYLISKLIILNIKDSLYEKEVLNDFGYLYYPYKR